MRLDLAAVDSQDVFYDEGSRAIALGSHVALVCARNRTPFAIRNAADALAGLRAVALAASAPTGRRRPVHEPRCEPEGELPVRFEVELAFVSRDQIHLDTAGVIHIGPRLGLRANPGRPTTVDTLLALDRAAGIAAADLAGDPIAVARGEQPDPPTFPSPGPGAPQHRSCTFRSSSGIGTQGSPPRPRRCSGRKGSPSSTPRSAPRGRTATPNAGWAACAANAPTGR